MSDLNDRLVPRGVSDHLITLVHGVTDGSVQIFPASYFAIHIRTWLALDEQRCLWVKQQQMEVRVYRRSE
jgi:hypothetical protein